MGDCSIEGRCGDTRWWPTPTGELQAVAPKWGREGLGWACALRPRTQQAEIGCCASRPILAFGALRNQRSWRKRRRGCPRETLASISGTTVLLEFVPWCRVKRFYCSSFGGRWITRGFRLRRLTNCGGRLGCNEFVGVRKGGAEPPA